MSVHRAKELRQNSSAAERRMWRLLRVFRTGGYHFRKQAQIGPYYADIACHHAKLVIELDGNTHGTDEAARHDARRDAFLRSRGYTVLRFANNDVIQNPDGVFQVVQATLEERPTNRRSNRKTPSPTLPTRGRVWPGAFCGMVPRPLSGTLPLVGRDREGVNPANDINRRSNS